MPTDTEPTYTQPTDTTPDTLPADVVPRPPLPKRGQRDRPLFDRDLIGPALVDSVRKLDPRVMVHKPVMFVVEVGSVVCTLLFLRDFSSSTGGENVFTGLVTAWLWFTVGFANFAEALAEGRGKAQAATLRAARADTMAAVRLPDGSMTQRGSSELTVGDIVVVTAGEVIPGDGGIIEGIASVDESAITGESAPVIRIDGIEVVRGLRGWSLVPIVVLSAREAEAAKVAALDAGADDYVTKPFGMDELLARLRAALRRSSPADEVPVVVTDHFTVDVGAGRVQRDGRDVHLTPTEWHMLDILVRHPDKLISQRQLLREVWGPSYETETNYLRLYIAQLRRKLEPDPGQPRYLITEAGMGYRFQPDGHSDGN